MIGRWGRRLLGGLGLLAVILAGVFGIAPGLLPAGLREPLVAVTEQADQGPILISLAVVAGLAALAYLRSAGPAPQRRDPLVEATPETASRPVAELGADFTDRVSREWRDSRTDGQISDQLRDRARQVLTWELDCSPADATTMLDAGEWTDDPIAAATVSTDQSYPLTHRFRKWTQPRAAREREVDRTVRAIYRIVTDEDATALPAGEP